MAANNDLSEVAKAHALIHDRLERIEQSLCGFVQHVIKEMNVTLADREWCRIDGDSRSKKAISLKRALDEAGKTANQILEIDDLVGVRAVVLRLSDVERLSKAILNSSALKLIDPRPRKTQDKLTGYRALHIKGKFNDGSGEVGCEIQIRTELQDAWAVVSRKDLYHKEASAVIRRLMWLQAEHLAVVDEAFELIGAMSEDYVIRPIAMPKSAQVAPVELEAGR